MSLILDGVPEDVPGLISASWYDVPSMRVGITDRRRRVTRWIRSIILHTTIGDEPQTVLPYSGPMGMASGTVTAWARDNQHAGSHLLIDGDGSVWCVADLIREATYHAKSINEVSIGVEICQSHKLQIWESSQRPALIKLLDFLTRRLGIARQYQYPYHGEAEPVARLAMGGADCVGIFGHRDQTIQRGPGDPGDAVFKWLHEAGYEPLDFARRDDCEAWIPRQAQLGVHTDGIPGPTTVRALQAAGYPHGMWISRPGDGI